MAGSDLNVIAIIGKVTRDPELRYTMDKTPVMRINLASHKAYRKPDGEWKTKTCYIDVLVFGKFAQSVHGKIKPGMYCDVTGRLESDQWQTHDGKEYTKNYIYSDHLKYSEERKILDNNTDRPPLAPNKD